MLNYLRTHTKTVIWTVILSFALWGAVSIGSQAQQKGRYAGEVFGKHVTFQEFDSFYRGAQIFSFGQDVSKDPDLLRQVAWQNLIYAREAKRKNFQVSDDEVRNELVRLLTSFGFTSPDPKAYRGWLRSNLKMEPQEFEKQLREVIRVQKLLKGISQVPLDDPKDDEVQQFYTMENSRIGVEGMIFDTLKEAEDFTSKAATPDDWKTATASSQDKMISLAEAPLAEIADALHLETSYALELQKLPENAISQPIPFRGKIAVFHVTSKKDASTASLQDDAKKALIEKVAERKKRLYFMSWHLHLMKEASLKDHFAETSESPR